MPVQDLEDKFLSYRLVGKLANIYADVDEVAIKRASKFKTVTGADTITVQKKNGQPFEYAHTAKQFFFGNRIPESKDLSDAFFNRWDVIKFQRKFVDEPDEKDPHQHKKRPRERILAEIAKEHSGILNILIPRILEINKSGEIPNAMNVDDVRELWLYHSDFISQFIQDCTERDPLTGQVPLKELYTAYVAFCIRKKITPRFEKTFNQRIRAMGFFDFDTKDDKGVHILRLKK